jgi:hypothetical protein
MYPKLLFCHATSLSVGIYRVYNEGMYSLTDHENWLTILPSIAILLSNQTVKVTIWDRYICNHCSMILITVHQNTLSTHYTYCTLQGVVIILHTISLKCPQKVEHVYFMH